MQLFYSPNFDSASKEILIEGQEAQHISRVLRHQIGDILHITNGRGDVAKGSISTITKNRVTLSISERHFLEKPPSANIILAIGIIKQRDRLEMLIEKATEIGVGTICLMQTSRSERSNIRLDRLEAIAISAMKQSLQAWVPIVRLATIEEALEGSSQSYIAHEQPMDTKLTRFDGVDISQPLTLFVGPEGGFTDEEVQKVVNGGSKVVDLGENRLRAETASLKLLSMISYATAHLRDAKGVSLYRIFK
jgi:16S rRNA (uracil1498-N3)-methyltransferase